MLTPRFELSQTEAEVLITVHAPYANIKDTEVYVEGDDLRFYSTPYYLRLKLPGEIVENDESTGSYDCDKGDFVLKFSKVNRGQHFENLDMITTLLAPPKENKNFLAAKIEVISNPAASEKDGDADENEEVDEEAQSIDWLLPQTLPTVAAPLLPGAPKYGFANKISGALGSFDAAWIKEVIDLPMPDSVPMENRRETREARELEDFSEDHYMADLISEESVEPFINFVPDFSTLTADDVSLNDNEKDLLKELPNKDYLLDNEEMKTVLCGMVDIIFAFCYNRRITLGENTPESSWDINKLSSTLSWFQQFSSMDETIRACVRRSLCYPLCRNWNLSMKTFEDVKKVVKLGKKYIVKVFCEIHEMFNESCEPRYLLNQLYIKDYLIWLQKTSSSTIESIVPILDEITPKKSDMGLDLEELEVAAWSVHSENLVFENDVDAVIDKMENSTLSEKVFKLVIGSPEKNDSESDSDSDTDSSSSSDSDSSSSSSSSSDSSSSDSSDTSAATITGKIDKLDSDDTSDTDPSCEMFFSPAISPDRKK